jgi:hypothetical protein
MSDNFRDSKFDEWLRSFDPYTHSMTVIQEPHRLAHDGMIFHATHKKDALANGASHDHLLRVPAGVYPHFNRLMFSVSAGDCDAYLYEGATVSADGTPETVYNTNRNSTNAAETLLFTDPTVTDPGTEIHHVWMPPTGAGVGSSTGLSKVSFDEEWLLKPSTDYLIRLTNNSGGAIDIWHEMLFYEVSYDV